MRSPLGTALVLAALIVGALLSCQRALAGPTSPPPSDDLFRIRLSPDAASGVVAARVVANRWPQEFFGRLGHLRLRNVSTDKEFTLQDRAPPYFEEQLYVGELPAGVYELRAFENFYYGGRVSGSQKIAVSGSGQFHVSAGRLTDLGTIVFLRPLFESREYKLALEAGERAITRVQPLIDSATGDALLSGGALSWDADRAALEAVRLSPAQRQLTQDLDRQGFLTATGAVMFGEAFGQLVVRDAAGHWGSQQLPTIAPITSVAESKDGVVAAGSTEGGLWLRARNGSSWEARWLPRADAVVRHLAFDGTGRLLAIAETPGCLHVYSMESGDTPWRDAYQLPVTKVPRKMGALFRSAFIANDEVRIFTVQGTVWYGGPAIVSLSLSDGRSDTSAIYSMRHAGAAPDGTLYAISGLAFSETLKVSTDAVTWESRGASPGSALNIVFRSADEGYLIGKGPALWKTTDSGRTWQRWSDVPLGSARLILLAPSTEMLLLTRDGLTLHTGDGGKTWQEERSLRTF